MSIAAFGLFLAVPLWAQHGGHGGGGGHGGFGGGHSSGLSGGHIGGGGFSHSASGISHAPSFPHNFSRGPFLHNGFRGRNGVGLRLRTYGFGNRWGYGSGYPWGYGYYDPWLWDWWDSDSSYDDSYNQDLATAAEMNRENLEEQQMLRQEQADGDQDAYADRYDGPHRSYNNSDSNAQPEKKGTPMFSDTILVFRDKHQEEVENYAIVGNTLWNFAPQHTEKISLADLDLAATKKANEDRGLTFRLPSGS